MLLPIRTGRSAEILSCLPAPWWAHKQPFAWMWKVYLHLPLVIHHSYSNSKGVCWTALFSVNYLFGFTRCYITPFLPTKFWVCLFEHCTTWMTSLDKVLHNLTQLPWLHIRFEAMGCRKPESLFSNLLLRPSTQLLSRVMLCAFFTNKKL